MNIRIHTTIAVCLLLCVNESIADTTGFLHPLRYVIRDVQFNPDGSSSFELASTGAPVYTTLGDYSSNLSIPGGRLEFYQNVKRDGIWRYELLPTSMGLSVNTWGEALMKTPPSPPPGRFTRGADVESYSCTRFGYLVNEKVIAIVPNSSQNRVQAGECSGSTDTVRPPPPGYCFMSDPSITFAFGTMKKEDASGASETREVGVTCVGNNVNYTLSTTPTKIILSNNLEANITVDGAALGKTFTGVEGVNRHSMTVTLSGTPDNTGAFSGTAVMRVTYS
ncbi:hypothetical protein [Klebsiella oxytoca]|uniref:hypothetical protein n=2 Tax=Klebsiella oxytoca TaxID=571 RepID=UPI00397086F7